jgi:hypothetical protein
VAIVPRRGSLEEAWIDIGVDDLTKYRILEYLYESDGDGADVWSLATALGFHSLDQTASAVEELYRSGLLWLEWNSGRPARCGLTAATVVRSTIGELFALGRFSKSTPELLARLARRSLDRVRAQRGRRRTATPSVEVYPSAAIR